MESLSSLLFLVLIVGSFYLLAIRPQKARLRVLQETQSSLQPGVDVMTTAGLYGTVTAVTDEDVTLRIAPGVDVRFARAAIAKRTSDLPETAETAETAEAAPTIPPG